MIHFFADNTSAIKTIFDPRPRPGQLLAYQFHKKVCTFLDARPEHRVEIAWSPGHRNILGNERADELAKEGAELATDGTGTRSHAIRRSKEKGKKTWVKEWKESTKTGGFAVANRLPPALKATPHFTALKREIFGRTVQCRTGHGYVGEYYSRFVPSEDVDCPCGEALQTREHLLQECPTYENHRHILRKVSRDIVLSEILGSRNGIEALAEFLDISGAFTKTGKRHEKRELPVIEDEPDSPEDEEEEPDDEEDD